MIHENWWFVHKIRYVWSFFCHFRGFKRRQRLLFGSQTSTDIEEWRPGHTNAKKSKTVTLTSIKKKRRRTYWRLSDFQRSSRILMIFWAIPWLQKALGDNWDFKGAFEYAKWLNTCISLSGTPQITLMSCIHQRRLQFSKIKDVHDFEVEKWTKISVYPNFRGAGRRLQL